MATGAPGLAAWGLAASATMWFLLYEPVAVLTGLRGERLRRAAGTGALLYAAGLAFAATVLGLAALAAGPPSARLTALVPAGLAIILVPVVLRGRQKTLLAELLVVAALAAVLLPVAAASGVDGRFALMALGVWLASFALITLVVHAVKARHKQVSGMRWTVRAAPLLAGITVFGAAALVALETVPLPVGLALLPAALLVLLVSALRVHPRSLRLVGWSVVGANAVTLLLLLLA